jgi:glycosyltransferase involved in cell wall biosynthesis
MGAAGLRHQDAKEPSVTNSDPTARPAGAGRLGYLVKAFPRVSETFILNEILELERQGLDLRIYSMIDPPDRLRHRLFDKVRSPITYLPNPLWVNFGAVLADHVRQFRRAPRRYLSALACALTSGEWDLVERFVQAGCLAQRLHRDGVTHLHAGFVHTPGSVAWLASQLTGLTFSLASHAKDLYHSRPAVLRRKLLAARVVFTCTQYNVPHLEQLCAGAGAVRVRHVYHGTDLGRFKFGIYGRSKPPVVLAVARLVEKKGLDTLIRACGALRDRGRDFRCHIVGDGVLKGALAQLVGELKLNRLVTLEGALDQEEVLAWYRRATVLALPCMVTSDGDRDGIPNVLIEAAACGVPIVTTGVSGIPELIEHGKSGLVVPPGDHLALADAVEGMLQSVVLREGLRVNARARVTEAFDVERNAVAIGAELCAVMNTALRDQVPDRAGAMESVPKPAS